MTERTRLSADSLVWQQMFWPHPLSEAAVLSLLRDWAARRHAPQIVLEARADASGVEYLVGTQLRHAPSIRRSIEHLVSGSVVTSYPTDDRDQITTARRVRLTTTSRPLEPLDRAASSRSILSALTAVRRRERLLIQVVLGPRRQPNLPPPRPNVEGQSIASKLLTGVQTDARPDARQALLRKLGQHGFAASVRIGVDAASAERRRSLLLGLAAAISTVEAAGVHLKLAPAEPHRLNQPRSTWSLFTRAQHLNVAEVSHLLGLPISDDDDPFPGQPPRHPKPIRPTPAVQTGERVVATATAPGSAGTVGYNVTDALRHTWVIGPNGVGKSTLLLNLIVQDLHAGRPVVVIEPKDLVSDLLARIPDNRKRDVVLLDPLDAAPVGINPLHRGSDEAGQRTPHLLADSLFGTLRALYGDSLGPRSADILRSCLDVLAQRDDASLVMLPLLLTNPGFRRSLTQHAIRDDPFAAGPFWQWFDSLSPEATATVVAPLSNKLRPLLGRQLRAVLGQRTPSFNIRQVLTDNKVLLVPLQKGVIGPEAAQLLGALVVAELWQAIRERAAVPEHSRTPVMVYIDEVQDYLKLPATDLGDAFAQGRSLGIGIHAAHQFEGQLPKSMLDTFRSNVRSRICFQLQAGDARDMATGQSVLTPEDFGTLPAHHIYASLMRDNSIQPWTSGVTQPPPPITSNPNEIRRLSRDTYGRPLDEIEAGFAELLEPPVDDVPVDGAPVRRKRRQS